MNADNSGSVFSICTIHVQHVVFSRKIFCIKPKRFLFTNGRRKPESSAYLRLGVLNTIEKVESDLFIYSLFLIVFIRVDSWANSFFVKFGCGCVSLWAVKPKLFRQHFAQSGFQHIGIAHHPQIVRMGSIGCRFAV